MVTFRRRVGQLDPPRQVRDGKKKNKMEKESRGKSCSCSAQTQCHRYHPGQTLLAHLAPPCISEAPSAAVMCQLAVTPCTSSHIRGFFAITRAPSPSPPGVGLGRRQRGGEALGWGSRSPAAHAFLYGNNTLPLTWFLAGQCSRGTTSTMLLLAPPTRATRRGSMVIFVRSYWRGEEAACLLSLGNRWHRRLCLRLPRRLCRRRAGWHHPIAGKPSMPRSCHYGAFRYFARGVTVSSGGVVHGRPVRTTGSPSGEPRGESGIDLAGSRRPE